MNVPFMYKYRPSYFKDLEIDNDIIDILNTMISMNNLTILFIGDSGSGKTTLINTLITEYYGNSQYIDDILVINSLKEQGIQYYRTEVKTFCQTRCSIQGKKKIVILDDIDNINEQSQQVFRNCIDKYSNNVHFISSCSNIQKVIDSLQSRKIIIKLKPFTNDRLNIILQKTKKSENLICDSKTDRLILSVSNGSVCVLLNYLEKFKIINEPITYDLVSKVCTNISFTVFDMYTNAVIQSNLNGAVHILYDLFIILNFSR
jgi:DNA polymerase III delta prime subunit